MKVLLIYLLVCIVEAIILNRMLGSGKYQELEEKRFGDDPNHKRLEEHLPKSPFWTAIMLVLVFFFGNPMFLFKLIKRIFV